MRKNEAVPEESTTSATWHHVAAAHRGDPAAVATRAAAGVGSVLRDEGNTSAAPVPSEAAIDTESRDVVAAEAPVA